MDETIIESKDLQSGEEKGKIVLKGLKESQKKKLLTGALNGIVGIAGGVGLMSAFSFVSKDDAGNAIQPENSNQEEDNNGADSMVEEPVIIYTDAPFANSITDDMSFNEAFGAARSEVGQGGFFEWNGETYNTYYKDEWDAMSEAEQNEFLNSVDENAIETVTVVEPDPESITQPEPTLEPEVVYEITEEDYIETGDLNQDGKVDVARVDANGNDIPDFVLDINGDGTMDQLYLDLDPNAQELPDDVVIVQLEQDIDPFSEQNNDNQGIASVDPLVPDPLSPSDLNPEIDNNHNMDGYV